MTYLARLRTMPVGKVDGAIVIWAAMPSSRKKAQGKNFPILKKYWKNIEIV